MKSIRDIQTKHGLFRVCQENPGYGLCWVHYMNDREIERSGGRFYSDMGNGWNKDPVIACVQGIRKKCSKIRKLLTVG